jgi:predicted negative regulator of RcsB-dependent stress response
MATYDLEQQEQLDQVKHFWNQYGNLITWLLVLILGGYAAWMGYQYLQHQKAGAAANLYEELDSAAQAGNTDKVLQAFNDLKDKYAGTTFAEQGALLAARAAAERQKADPAKAALQWLVDSGKNANLVAVARLRLAGMQLDAKQFDEALKTLSAEMPEEFAPLADDRRGDVLMAQGKKDDAAKAYQSAWKGLDSEVEYRRFIDGKLTALGLPPEPASKSTVGPLGGGMPVLPPGTLPAN